MTDALGVDGRLPRQERSRWLDELVAHPDAEIRRLFWGQADITPYQRAEVPDAVEMLFGGLQADDPAVRALAKGLGAWLDSARAERPTDEIAAETLTLMGIDTFDIVARQSLDDLALRLWREYPRWYAWTSKFVLAPNADLRAAFMRALALTQAIVPGSATQRIPIWLGLSGRSGRDLPDRYIDIGLLGLRALRLPKNFDASVSSGALSISNDSLCATALLDWAGGRSGLHLQVMRRWRALKHAYLINRKRSEDIFYQLVAERADIADELRDLWSKDVFKATRPKGGHARPRIPEPSLVDKFIAERNTREWAFEKAEAVNLIAERERFAQLTANASYAVKTSCRIGRSFLDYGNAPMVLRSRAALSLAFVSLRWAPNDPHGWALWRDALISLGRFNDAMLVAWESIRRFPENPHFAIDLSLIWKRAGDPRRAESLLRSAILQTNDSSARVNYAQLIMRDKSRVADAERVLLETTDYLEQSAGTATDVYFIARGLRAYLMLGNPQRKAEADSYLLQSITLAESISTRKRESASVPRLAIRARIVLAMHRAREKAQRGWAEEYLKALVDKTRDTKARTALARLIFRDPARHREAEPLFRQSARENDPVAKEWLERLLEQKKAQKAPVAEHEAATLRALDDAIEVSSFEIDDIVAPDASDDGEQEAGRQSALEPPPATVGLVPEHSVDTTEYASPADLAPPADFAPEEAEDSLTPTDVPPGEEKKPPTSVEASPEEGEVLRTSAEAPPEEEQKPPAALLAKGEGPPERKVAADAPANPKKTVPQEQEPAAAIDSEEAIARSDLGVLAIDPTGRAQRAAFLRANGSKAERIQAEKELRQLDDGDQLEFARFLLLQSSGFADAHRPAQEKGSFGVMLLEAIRRQSMEAIVNLSLDQDNHVERFICSFAQYLIEPENPKLRSVVEAQLQTDPKSVGLASRAMLEMIKSSSFDAIAKHNGGREHLFAALGASFEVKLVA